jgi:hypothetical protein
MITDKVQTFIQTLITKSTRRQRKERLVIEVQDQQVSTVLRLQIAIVPSTS